MNQTLPQKILIVGSDHVWSIERIYLKYLSALGIETSLFPAQNFFFDYYNRNLFSKLFFRSGISSIYKKINKQLLDLSQQFKPNVIWIFKGMEIFPETINELKAQGSKLVNYNPDNPFLFTGSGSGNKNIRQCIPFYDLHFTYSLEIERQLKEQYGCATAMLPFGFDITESLYEKCKSLSEIKKVCFLGNPDKQRASFILQLLGQGIEIDVYGNDWAKFLVHKNLSVYKAVYGDEFWETLVRYRVQLNLMRVHNERSHNMRTFEIPGVGGIQLAPDTPEHRSFFEDGKNIFLFNYAEDCAMKIKSLFSLSDHEVQNIRESARQKSISSGCDYRNRAYYAAGVIEKLMNTHSV